MFYLTIKSQLLGMKYVCKHQYLRKFSENSTGMTLLFPRKTRGQTCGKRDVIRLVDASKMAQNKSSFRPNCH